MSRIGKKPVVVPAGVEVAVDANNVVTVKGPKGQLSQQISKLIKVEVADGAVNVSRDSDQRENRSQHGLARTLINNMVTGVTAGFEKKMQLVGVGYKAEKKGKTLVMNLGYSHQVIVPEIPGITIDVPAANQIVISGPDKQMVGQFASEVRGKRPPEPYKGKGIRYVGEYVRRKEGKAAKK